MNNNIHNNYYVYYYAIRFNFRDRDFQRLRVPFPQWLVSTEEYSSSV